MPARPRRRRLYRQQRLRRAHGRGRAQYALLVLYGSNLGTAEELAIRVADLAEVNGFATKLAALDEYVGKLRLRAAC